MRNIISAVFICMFFTIQAIASTGKAGSDIRWELNNGVLTFSGSGVMADFNSVPYNPRLIKSVIINDGITSIGANAFKGCVNMTSVSIPSSVKEIGNNAFSGCKSLSIIMIPYGVTSIGKNTFSGCSLITDLDLPGSVKTIGEGAFSGCKNLIKIRIPSSVVTVGSDAFKGCDHIEKITELPEVITANQAYRYNLSSAIVDKYWKDLQEEIASSMASATPAPLNSDSHKPNIPTVVSDVDVSIPHTHSRNDKTFALIVSNENYARMDDVPFAISDGQTFRSYCEHTLGIPESNILYYTDATSGVMREMLTEIKMANRIIGNEMKVIFYYSGHGAPDPTTKEGFLIPVDARSVNPEVCLPLSKLYESLGKLDVAMTTVFLDACFSGGERNGGTLLADNGERAVKISQKNVAPTGRMVVFSATDGDQTALPYKEKGHGIFTYYLLKKLKESGGSASLAELADYVKSNVSSTAFSAGRKAQTPTVSVSKSVSEDWQTHSLNR